MSRRAAVPRMVIPPQQSSLYAIGRRNLLDAFEWTDAAWNGWLVNASYVPDFLNHQYVADVLATAIVGGPVPVIPTGVNQAGFAQSQGLRFPAVTTPYPLAGFILASAPPPSADPRTGFLVGYFGTGIGFGGLVTTEDVYVVIDQQLGGLFAP